MKQYSNRFAVVVLICLKEIIFYILSYLEFLCLQIYDFSFSTVGRNIAGNNHRLCDDAALVFRQLNLLLTPIKTTKVEPLFLRRTIAKPFMLYAVQFVFQLALPFIGFGSNVFKIFVLVSKAIPIQYIIKNGIPGIKNSIRNPNSFGISIL